MPSPSAFPAVDAVIEEISGDISLSPTDRLRYLWRNARRNVMDYARGPRSRAFRPDLARARAIAAGQSPGRLLTELFIEAELPKMLAVDRIDVVEVGCGSGSMAYRLARLGCCGTYLGIDVKDRFRRDHPSDFPFEVTFSLEDAHRFMPSRPFDLIVSVSTLEHIPRDAALIRRLASMVKSGGIELHVVPSGASLAIYLWHGYRQYTPAALASKFGPDIEIVGIGGFGSYILHFFAITIPELIFRRSLRKAAPQLYGSMLQRALQIDAIAPIMPTAFAVICRH
jgi:2-polyprenyl-3-methyl-5-hydroxy-6-metoxy-1,4-benzoquinol methylase